MNDLKEKGILSQEEFEKEKQKLLNETATDEKANAEAPASGYTDFSHLGIIKGSFAAFASVFKLTGFKGRMSRFDFFGFGCVAALLSSIISGVCFIIAQTGETGMIISDCITGLWGLVFICLALFSQVKRLHDVNMRGWWMLTYFVPLVTMFFKGDKETNRFGPAPATDEKKGTT